MTCLKYYRADSIVDALSTLSEAGEEALVLAGGTDIMVGMNNGHTSSNKSIVYIGDIPELKNIIISEDKIRIGCLVTASQIAEDPDLLQEVPALTMAAYEMASPQVRNRATIGGNLGTASPSGDLITPLIALDAEALILGKEEKRIKVADLITGVKKTCLAHDEIISEVIIPKSSALSSGAFVKIGKRKAMTISIANVACQLTLAEDKETIADIKVSIGACAPTVVRAELLEEALIGRNVEIIKNVAPLARQAISPITDQRATSWYRLEVIPAIVSRVVLKAAAQIRGESMDSEVI